MTDAFQILATEYRPMVLAYLRAIVKDEHLAEDLTQETFIAAQDTLTGFHEGGNFGRWLRGIARNRALMHWRTARSRPLVVDSRVVEGINEVFDEFDRNQEDAAWWERRKRALQECVAGLGEHMRSAVEKVYFQGYSIEEAAIALRSSNAAVGQRLCRARRGLRACVDEKLKTENRDG